MNSFRQYVAEAIGTCVLVLMGCGTAMLVGVDAVSGSGYLLTALAFGFSIVAMAYCVGNISGCHINPAVTLGVYLSGGIEAKKVLGYICAQVIGALAGAGLLALIFSTGNVVDQTGGFGSNGLTGVNGSVVAGLLVEIVLTFIFVLTIIGVTAKKSGHGSFGGLIIGLTLTFVHILGIGLTGTSVNPARSSNRQCRTVGITLGLYCRTVTGCRFGSCHLPLLERRRFLKATTAHGL